MHPQTVISTLYGQARGYHRFDIRRQVFAHEKLSREALEHLKDQGFQRHVQRSIARFPFYAERVKEYRGALPKPGERVRPEELPVWTRELQREFFKQQERPADALYVRWSSGSTGNPVYYYATRESYEWRTSIMDRAYTWAHAEEGVRSVHVWGTDLKPPRGFHKVKRRVHLELQRRKYFDAFKEFSDAERAECCHIINDVKPHAIVGYAGMLVDIARFARDTGALSWKARTLIATAEGLLEGQRGLLERELAHEVFDSYGAREVMNIGSECEAHQGLHLATDNLFVEVVDDTGNPVPPGTGGRVLVTDFHNSATPLIRYEVGDYATMCADEPCSCGRPFSRLAHVDGRSQDMIYTPKGPITVILMSHILRDYDWIEGHQIVQSSPDRILLRLLTRRELDPEWMNPLLARLHQRFGDMTIECERVDELQRRPSGKFQLLISTLTPPAQEPGAKLETAC